MYRLINWVLENIGFYKFLGDVCSGNIHEKCASIVHKVMVHFGSCMYQQDIYRVVI